MYIPTVQPHWVHFPRAITRAWVGLLGRLWYILVEEGLPFFLRYRGPIWVDGKVVKNQVKNWKIAFLAFFVHLVKCPNHHNKVPFFLFFTLQRIERDWNKCNWAPWVWYLGNKPNIFMTKMWDTGTLVTVSQLQFLLFDHFMMLQITFNCDKCHTIVSYSIWDVKKGENKYSNNSNLVIFRSQKIAHYSDKCHKIILWLSWNKAPKSLLIYICNFSDFLAGKFKLLKW